jgi:hypothetical protein
MHRYTLKEIQFIEQHIAGRSYAEMTGLFNEHFRLRGKKKITFEQMKGVLQYHKLSNGLPRRFQPGHTPHNKDIKGFCTPGLARSQYKPGNIPFICKPIGSERIKTLVNGMRYVEVKIAHPNVWKSKHTVVWEKSNGPVPKGHKIIFADGNRRNFKLGNLVLVSNRELIVMNRNGLIFDNSEFTKTGKLIAELRILINDRKDTKDKIR